MPIFRRSLALERRFDRGIYDAGINELAEFGEYQDFSRWPVRNLRDYWCWVAPDYPYDILKRCKMNKRTPDQCLADTDALQQKYRHAEGVILVLQYRFGDVGHFRARLKWFLDEFNTACFCVGNTCKQRNRSVLLDIGRILCEVLPVNCVPHILGCPTPLLDYLVAKAPFDFSIDTNKFFRRHGRMASGKAERSLFLREYLAEHGILPTCKTKTFPTLDDYFSRDLSLREYLY